MPAQKRSHETLEDDPLLNNQNHHEQQEEDGEESDRSPSSSSGEKDEFVLVRLAEIRKEVQCPICLGIIRKTRTVMECLHRFCRECIDKSMRLGNNECPACRTHCASRRSLRDDPNYDALIAALYPDIDEYEEEELAFHEEEKARNKQIQASIARTFQRQTEALSRKRTSAKATAAAFVRRSQVRHGRRKNYRAIENQESDEEDDANGNKDSSSAEEQSPEVKPKRSKRWSGVRFSSNADGGGGDENENRESRSPSVGLIGSSSDRLAWGKGGMRSHTRYGSASGGGGKNGRNSRFTKLIEYFRNLEENNSDEMVIEVMLFSFDKQRIPNLEQPYLCCRPSLSVRHLCQYIAVQTEFPQDEVEILVVKELLRSKSDPSNSKSVPISDSSIKDECCKTEMQILEAQETLGGIQAICNLSQGQLLLAYRQKFSA